MRTIIAVMGGITIIAVSVLPAAASTGSVHRHDVIAAKGTSAAKIPGDLDGDGRSDLVVSKEANFQVTYSSFELAGHHTLTYTLPDSEAPLSLATGDFNGDGFADLAVGSPFSEPDHGSQDGAVYVYYGSAAGLTGPQEFKGPHHKDTNFGDRVFAVNMNGDAYSDLVVDDQVEATKLKVLYGHAGGLSTAGATTLPVKNVGDIAVGDLNGDGYPDLAIGSPDAGKSKDADHHEIFIGYEGLVSVFYGTKHGFAAKPQTIHGLAVGTKYGSLGETVAIAKVNGDKDADLVLGAPDVSFGKKEDIGEVAVLYGSKGGVTPGNHTIMGLDTAGVPGHAEAGDGLGASLATTDLNGDGYADVAVGAVQEDNGDGEVVVLRGSKQGLTAKNAQLLNRATIPGTHGSYAPAQYGVTLVALNPTGGKYGAIAIGAPYYGPHQDYGDGIVDVFSGSKQGLKTSMATRTTNPNETEFYGQALAP